MRTPERPDHQRVIVENDEALRAAQEELRKARPILEEAHRIEQAIAKGRRLRDAHR